MGLDRSQHEAGKSLTSQHALTLPGASGCPDGLPVRGPQRRQQAARAQAARRLASATSKPRTCRAAVDGAPGGSGPARAGSTASRASGRAAAGP